MRYRDLFTRLELPTLHPSNFAYSVWREFKNPRLAFVMQCTGEGDLDNEPTRRLIVESGHKTISNLGLSKRDLNGHRRPREDIYNVKNATIA